jgi:hypothetical protein
MVVTHPNLLFSSETETRSADRKVQSGGGYGQLYRISVLVPCVISVLVLDPSERLGCL